MSSEGTPDRESRFHETIAEFQSDRDVQAVSGLPRYRVDPAAERLFEVDREEALGRHIDDWLAQHDAVRDEAASLNDCVLDGHTEIVTRRACRTGARRRGDPLDPDRDRR